MRDTVIQSIHGAVPYDIPLLLADPDYFRILDTPAQPDLAGLLFKRALKASIGAQPLTRQLSAHHTVSIIVEDLSQKIGSDLCFCHFIFH